MTRFFDPIAQEYRDLNIGKRAGETAAPPSSTTNGFCTMNGHDFDIVTNICRRCTVNKTAWQTAKNAGVMMP